MSNIGECLGYPYPSTRSIGHSILFSVNSRLFMAIAYMGLMG